MKISHQEILTSIAERWIDNFGRGSIPKRRLPPHAYDPSPCLVVSVLPDDSGPSAATVQYFAASCRSTCALDWPPTPDAKFLYVVTPDGERFSINTWGNWRPDSAELFRKFCTASGRTCGVLGSDGMIAFGSTKISFFDCKLIEPKQSKRRQIKTVTEAGKDVIGTAKKLMRSRKDVSKDLEYEDLQGDFAAHDDELHEKLQRKFVRRLKALQTELSVEFGPPNECGTTSHEKIHFGEVIQYAIWHRKTKVLFLVAFQDDRESPYSLVLGTTRNAS